MAKETKAESSAREPRHCDDYIHDCKYPHCLRVWLLRQRLPAADGMLLGTAGFNPKLFATWNPPEGAKQRVRVTMASRFGDVGITPNLDAEHGYSWRVHLDSLSDFSETA